MRTMKGRFRPNNPQKYKGNVSDIIYRSSYELKFMMYCDSTPNIIEWSSEETIIPYTSPRDNRIHRYFVDFLIKVKKKDIVETYLIEVKPESQQRPPAPLKDGKKPSRSYINEVFTWGVNEAKWKAAQKYCEIKGWKFLVIGETQLNIKI